MFSTQKVAALAGTHMSRAAARQLRGTAGARRVPAAASRAGVALAHDIGLGGTAVVTAYRPAER